MSPFSIRSCLGSFGYVSHSLSDLLIKLTCRSSFPVHHHPYSPFSITFLSSRTLPNTAVPDPGWFSLLLRSIVPSCMDLDCLMSMPFRLMAWAEAAAVPPLLFIPAFTCGHMNRRVVVCFHITALAHITSDLARSLLPIRGSVA